MFVLPTSLSDRFQVNFTFYFLDVKLKEKELKKFSVPQEANVSSYYTIRQQLSNLNDGLHKYLVKPQYIVPFLQAGRMVHVRKYFDLTPLPLPLFFYYQLFFSKLSHR